MKAAPAISAALALGLGACASPVENKVQAYREDQARELVAAYEQARNRGDLLDICVKGALVSAAYRDAKRESDALAWKTRSDEDCRAARDALAPQAAAAP